MLTLKGNRVNITTSTTQRDNEMKIAFIDGCSNYLTNNSVYTDAKSSITYKFDTEKALKAFTGLFPKYCKIIERGCSNGVSGTGGFEFGATCDLSVRTNKVTGDINETAEKRVLKIKSILSSL